MATAENNNNGALNPDPQEGYLGLEKDLQEVRKELEAIECSNPRFARMRCITVVISILLPVLWIYLTLWVEAQHSRLGTYLYQWGSNIGESGPLAGGFIFCILFPIYFGLILFLWCPIFTWFEIRELAAIAASDVRPSEARVLLLEFERKWACDEIFGDSFFRRIISFVRLAMLLHVIEKSRSISYPTDQQGNAATLAPNTTAGDCDARLQKLLFSTFGVENPQGDKEGKNWRYDHFDWRYKNVWPTPPYSWSFLGFMMLDVFMLKATELGTFCCFCCFSFVVNSRHPAFDNDDEYKRFWILCAIIGYWVIPTVWTMRNVVTPWPKWLSTREKILLGFRPKISGAMELE